MLVQTHMPGLNSIPGPFVSKEYSLLIMVPNIMEIRLNL